MYGQEIFGQLSLLALILFVWTIFITNKIVTYLFSKTFKQDTLLFYQWLTFIIVVGLIVFLFKIYGVTFILSFYIGTSFLTGVYFYLVLKKQQPSWLTKLEIRSVGLKVLILLITVLMTGSLFALIILGLFRLM